MAVFHSRACRGFLLTSDRPGSAADQWSSIGVPIQADGSRGCSGQPSLPCAASTRRRVQSGHHPSVRVCRVVFTRCFTTHERVTKSKSTHRRLAADQCACSNLTLLKSKASAPSSAPLPIRRRTVQLLDVLESGLTLRQGADTPANVWLDRVAAAVRARARIPIPLNSSAP